MPPARAAASAADPDATAGRDAADVTAAGAVVLRGGREVLLVHRPKYDDWSFPKGKLDRGEHITAAAVREVAEETGLRVRLGRPLPSQHYPTGRAAKTVHYWLGRVEGSDDISHYRPNAEIDEVAWVPVDKAMRLLTYRRDRATLALAEERRKRTDTLVVVRHAQSRSRQRWQGDDRLRPLVEEGRRRARALVPVLAAYGARRVVTSSSTRCVDTVAPFCEAEGVVAELADVLSEEDATDHGVHALVEGLLATAPSAGATVVCSHRPVLPEVFEALDLDDPKLEKGELLVVHLRRGRVVAAERH